MVGSRVSFPCPPYGGESARPLSGYPDSLAVMIDPRLLRDDPDRVRAAQAKRGLSDEAVDRALAADTARRQAIATFETKRAEQKQLGKLIPQARGEEKQALLAQTKALAAEVKAAEGTQAEAEEEWQAALMSIPNLAADEAPAGGEDDYVVLETVGIPVEFDFEPRDHVELGKLLGAIDIERGAKVSGSRFYFLTGVGAQLELALVNLAMDQARNAGFTQVIAPSLVRPRAMDGTGFLGQAADDVYRIEGEDLYLVGTSEVPMAAYHSDEILDGSALPLRYAAFSPCFRKEAGSHGKDTRGIIRVHWFDKVEMFVYTTMEDSFAEHRRLLEWEKEFLDKLELSYRVIDVAAGDLGLSAQRKFDCEAWIPTQGRYRELTSTSNCTDFQTRRLDTRGRFEGEVRPVATLNGTLCAMTRTIVAILETHQQADGSVRVPQALQPYLGGLEVLKPIAR
jgi:seryl-tRNA synthetase